MYACTRISDCSPGWKLNNGTYGILWLNERVVDGDDVDVFMLDGISIDDPPNSSETVDADVGRHFGVMKGLEEAGQGAVC